MDFFYANLRVCSYLCIALWSTPCMSRTSTRSLIDQTVRPWTILSNLALDWLNPCNAHSASALGRIYLTWKESKQNTQDKIRGSLESQHISRPWVCVISNLDGQNLREDSNKRHHPYCPPLLFSPYQRGSPRSQGIRSSVRYFVHICGIWVGDILFWGLLSNLPVSLPHDLMIVRSLQALTWEKKPLAVLSRLLDAGSKNLGCGLTA